MPKRIHVAVVGLHFGSDFVPIYNDHPDVERVALCDLDEPLLHAVGDRFGIEDRFSKLEDLLASEYDAVHLLTPVSRHVEQALAVLGAGKHCACAVPMATDLNSLQQIIAAERQSGKNYMMMETAVYTREFLFAQDLVAKGAVGALTFLRGTYFQDLEGAYPVAWRSVPPSTTPRTRWPHSWRSRKRKRPASAASAPAASVRTSSSRTRTHSRSRPPSSSSRG